MLCVFDGSCGISHYCYTALGCETALHMLLSCEYDNICCTVHECTLVVCCGVHLIVLYVETHALFV